MRLPTQVFVSTEKPEAQKLNPISKDLFWKPRGGMWTSTLDDDRGQWVEWLEGQDYSLEDPKWGGDLWLLEPRDANVLVIATPDDYNQLAERFPYPDNPFAGRDLKMMDRLVDWVSVSENYDAMHVPDPRANRFSLFGNMDDYDKYYSAGLFFDTCDAESTCWFRWCFEGDPKIMQLV